MRASGVPGEPSFGSLGWGGGALICVLLMAGYSEARIHRSQAWAENQFTNAESQREALNGHADQARTRREYEAVIASYRRIVLEAPTSGKADASAFAVAELTAEMGRHFKDDIALYSAVREYKFLRREYPGSKHRIEALLAIGEIYKNDLGDDPDARVAFEELIRRYPHSQSTQQAQADLGSPVQQASLASGGTGKARGTDLKPDRESMQDDDAAPAEQSVPKDAAEKSVQVTAVQYWSTPDYTRVAVDLEQDVQFESQRIDHPARIFFDLKNTRLPSYLIGKSFDVDDGLVKKLRVAQYKPGKARLVIETADHASYNASLLLNPPRLLIDIHGEDLHSEQPLTVGDLKPASAENAVASRVVATAEKSLVGAGAGAPKKVIVEADDDDPPEVDADSVSPKASTKSLKAAIAPRSANRRVASAKSMREAQPTSSGDRSLIRTLGLKIGKIVIDPGHGGHDTGTIGPHGLLEKDLVLDVSKRLGKLLEARLGAEVVFTRHDDTFIPLETRTSIANQEQADLFVSVHANSSHDPDARGVETYYLNFTSSPEALEVAARENAASDKSIHELQDLVKKIALKEKIEESREFASDIQQSLHSGLAAKSPGIRDRGVKKAPFVVLIGANMPSILAEISFISNPGDEKRLRGPDYRQRIAESLYRGISRYVNGLGGVKVASRIEKASAE
jgi:N-acetylmuramoyl-L-alanine amidase